jgi:glucokinase
VTAAIAIDIGASGARIARVARSGLVGPVRRCRFGPGRWRERVIGRIAALVDGLVEGSEVAAGISFPAFLDGAGRVRHCVNLPALEGVDLRVELQGALGGLPAVPIPDVAAAALAEAQLGAGRGAERVLCVVLGSGVNAALTRRGRVVEVTFGCLGDAGHVIVAARGPRCPCGGIGHLEAICSGIGLREEGQAVGFRDVVDVVRALTGGDATAARLVRGAGRALGRAIATWTSMLAPEAVVLTGGLAALLGGPLLDGARRELARVAPPHLAAGLRLVPGELAESAPLVGAGLAALDRGGGGTGTDRRRSG